MWTTAMHPTDTVKGVDMATKSDAFGITSYSFWGILPVCRNHFDYPDHEVSGWSSLGKPARLPAAANSLSRSATCRPAHHSFSYTACVCSWRLPARSALSLQISDAAKLTDKPQS
jgi:hypothetical protein